MTSDSSNPYQPPSHDVEASPVAEALRKAIERPHNMLVSIIATIVVVAYSALALALVFGDSKADTLMGGLMASNWPLMGSWLWAMMRARDRTLLFGWLVIAMQLAIAVLMLTYLRVPVRQVLLVNGITVAFVLCLNLMLLWLCKSDLTNE